MMTGVEKDQGYSWLVFMATMVSQFIYGMLTYGCLSVLTYVWIDMFSITTESVVWASSVLGAILQLSGPVVTVIVHSLGAWKTQLIGILLSVTAAVATAFATQFWHILITFSALQGVGYAMVQMATIDVVADYFEKHKDKIYATLVTSFFGGLLLGPVTIEYTISIMGYRNGMLLMAAVSALNIPSAFIYRGYPCCFIIDLSDHEETEHSSQTTETCLERDSNGYLADDKLATEIAIKISKSPFHQRFSGIAQQHWVIIKQPAFMLILVFYILSMIGDNTVYALAVDFFVRKDVLTLPQAALGMTLCGASTVIGSVLVAVLSHWQLDRLMVNIISTIMFGISIVLFPVCPGIASSYSLMITFGLVDSIYGTNIISFVCQQFDSSDNKSSLIRLSYVFCCMGIGSLLGPVIAGNLITLVGLDGMFYIVGSLPIIAGVMLIPYWAVQKLKSNPTDGNSEDR